MILLIFLVYLGDREFYYFYLLMRKLSYREIMKVYVSYMVRKCWVYFLCYRKKEVGGRRCLGVRWGEEFVYYRKGFGFLLIGLGG